MKVDGLEPCDQPSMDWLKKQKNIVHSHNHDMHNGVRIGEAKQPGPQNQKRKKGLTRIWEEEGTSDSENSDPPDLLSSDSDNGPRSKPGKMCKTTCTKRSKKRGPPEIVDSDSEYEDVNDNDDEEDIRRINEVHA